MTAPVLSVRDLNKAFGAIVVAQGINVDLAAGARVGLIGPNGAGKTTFVNLLTGFLTPDSGTIEMAGISIERARPEDRVRCGLARTHQINALLMESSVRDNVAIAIAERERYAWRAIRYTRQWRQCLDEAQDRLHEIGLGCASNREVRHLSYGEQRLLEIAIALALKPKVLLLDEPGAGIPASEAHVIHEVLGRLPAEIAILIVEHDMELIFRFAREIIVLVQGRLLMRGTPSEISSNPEVRAVYLGQTIA
ncbi:MAG: ABC transporter ATP-binding protein [Pseudorhodoplanes sp.]|uniref:ABC transporter ATP-binding protein n=1 Tax=Pseudorhodoplanes sp. TaxID=1934341 RepID=UPI003D09A123